jgi:hypothetical protein
MVRTGSRPVAGRPPLLGFGNTTLDLAMFWYYHMSKPEGSVTFRPRDRLQKVAREYEQLAERAEQSRSSTVEQSSAQVVI